MTEKQKTLIVVQGPTASGKTALAVTLARSFSTEVISADSRQVYKEMFIGTARPTKEEMQEIPHHLIGHVSIHDDYNAHEFEKEFLKISEELFQRHDVIILCGGTGLYTRIALEGMDELPQKDDTIRQAIIQKFESEGIVSLQQELKEKDPEYFSQAEIENPQRLIRTLEILRITGEKMATIRKGAKKERPFQIIRLTLDWSREQLYDRINKRVDQMMESGLLNEVRELFPYRHLNALQTVGYTELFQYLEGKMSLEMAVEKIKQHTRNYAKRQITWFRKEPNSILIPGTYKTEDLLKMIPLSPSL